MQGTEAGQIEANLEWVRREIAVAALQVGRDPAGIRLIAVSKRQPADAIREAYAAGQRDFGENYVQELLDKRSQLADLADISWHFIGHLQSNKARMLAPFVALVHTVDSVHLAEELGLRAARVPRPLDVLIEVNVSGEGSKSGCAPSELAEVIAAAEGAGARAERASPGAGLRVRGLMTMPPATADPEGARRYFAGLRALRDLQGGAARLPELSQGMSNDFRIAIEEGATMVRIGTSIFGERST